MPAPSRQARRYDVAQTVHLVLLDPTPTGRLAALKLLLVEIENEIEEDAEGSMDRGLLTVAQEVSGALYAVEFAIVFPVATLDAPEANSVDLTCRTVCLPAQGGVVFAELARDKVFVRIRDAITAVLAAGKPLHGRIQLGP